uniref:NADH-ubiquinone oxidoreductase chain 1 n=1 Tax=Ixodes tasmani TaxID=59654 RepID=A0A3R5X1L5_9ACAR|nr:NADH dehydrogenase subunit 1 [Ixodes tasmani]QAB05962.1 NADH dehydrogenase subunit 1 [Ixodes tasmani]QAB05975.1 NADH dehydrogenase subunit 1 [Ixodes tasmani]QAB05988.1 NADH dehydrogenase subunit 1 [Ixodes tasmani]
MVNYLSYVFLLVCVLVSVAFFTLLERKILGYVHLRKGPNKVGFLGIFQPFSDAIKLFSKEMNFMLYINMFMYMFSSILSLLLMMMFWLLYKWKFNQFLFDYGMVMLLCISSLSVYVILWGGWSSNSKYSLLGAYRGVAQVISYEVSFAMILIGLVMFSESYSMIQIMGYQDFYQLFFGYFSVFMIWMITCFAETNRSPFDLSEGESELVSGFNIEYGSWNFAILFMAEYGNMIFFSLISSYLFLGREGIFFCFPLIIMIMFIFIRGTLVRYRYDKLMMMAWKVILPLSIFVIVINFCLKFLFFYCLCIN